MNFNGNIDTSVGLGNLYDDTSQCAKWLATAHRIVPRPQDVCAETYLCVSISVLLFSKAPWWYTQTCSIVFLTVRKMQDYV